MRAAHRVEPRPRPGADDRPRDRDADRPLLLCRPRLLRWPRGRPRTCGVWACTRGGARPSSGSAGRSISNACRGLPIETVEARLLRERGIGPWSLGVVALSGLGSYERGLVGDLGLLKLCKALYGRWVEAEETAELLAPYGEWQGLASVYMLGGFGRGLIPLPAGTRPGRMPAAA